MDTDAIQRAYPASAADRTAFNARDTDRADVNFDSHALLRFTPRAGPAYELGFARKSRSPSSLERYLWTPLSASAGQADGRTYLGNQEPTTPGYALLHLRVGYRWRRGLHVGLGVENVFDRRYADHLGGINRVAGGPLALGERIPGPGRWAYASVTYEF
ncbi:MAG: TonB-dependent receptor [Verrucomicrobia bacterium]|nr:TonB-dependent receptor [Verrucomicrobiota bacterium]